MGRVHQARQVSLKGNTGSLCVVTSTHRFTPDLGIVWWQLSRANLGTDKFPLCFCSLCDSGLLQLQALQL